MNEITLKQILQASGEVLEEHLPAVDQPVSGGYKKRVFFFFNFVSFWFCQFLNLDIGFHISSKLNCILFIDRRKETGKSALFHDRISIVCLLFHTKTFRKTIAVFFDAYSEGL